MKTSLPINFIEAAEEEHYDVNDLAPKWPFRLITVGCSGCGKTNNVVNLLKHIYFDTFYLYAKDLGEPYYVLLKDVFHDEKIQNIIESNFSSNIEDINIDELDR